MLIYKQDNDCVSIIESDTGDIIADSDTIDEAESFIQGYNKALKTIKLNKIKVGFVRDSKGDN